MLSSSSSMSVAERPNISNAASHLFSHSRDLTVTLGVPMESPREGLTSAPAAFTGDIESAAGKSEGEETEEKEEEAGENEEDGDEVEEAELEAEDGAA